jgi:hypothetical protein
VSDGTEAETTLLRSAAGEKLELPTDLVAFGGRVWFRPYQAYAPPGALRICYRNLRWRILRYNF